MQHRLGRLKIQKGVLHRQIEQSTLPLFFLRLFLFQGKTPRRAEFLGCGVKRRVLFGKHLVPLHSTRTQRQGQDLRNSTTAYVHAIFVIPSSNLLFEMIFRRGIRGVLIRVQILHVKTANIIDTVRNVCL